MKGWLTIVNLCSKLPTKRFVAHVGRISSIRWTQCSFILTAGHDGYVKLWNFSQQECLFKMNLDLNGIWTMQLDPQEALFRAVTTSTSRLETWEVTRLQELEAGVVMEWNRAAAHLQKLYRGKKTREVMEQLFKKKDTKSRVR